METTPQTEIQQFTSQLPPSEYFQHYYEVNEQLGHAVMSHAINIIRFGLDPKSKIEHQNQSCSGNEGIPTVNLNEMFALLSQQLKNQSKNDDNEAPIVFHS